MDELTRRDFFKCTAMASLTLLPFNFLLHQEAFAAASSSGANYYQQNRDAMVTSFSETLQGVAQFLQPELGEAVTKEVCSKSLSRFETLLSELPDVGGDRNIDTVYLVFAAWYVALYEPLREQGKSPEYLGKMIYDLNEYSLRSVPAAQRTAEKERLFSQAGIEQWKEWCAWTQKKEFPTNWVAHFVPGRSGDFDYGIDYTECAIVKYLKAKGIPEVTPSICATDFSRSKAYGTGLERFKTLARNQGVCNFRYKKDGAVTQDWTTEMILHQVT